MARSVGLVEGLNPLPDLFDPRPQSEQLAQLSRLDQLVIWLPQNIGAKSAAQTGSVKRAKFSRKAPNGIVTDSSEIE